MVTPSLLWALRNREPLEPGEARVVRHLGFWTMFVYVQWSAYDSIAPELLYGALIGAIVAVLVPALRSRISFVAMSAALLATMIAAHNATSIVGSVVLSVLAVIALRAPGRAIFAALLLLIALLVVLDPWFALSSQTAAHFVAAMMAMVMLVSMLVTRPRGMERVNVPSYVPPVPAARPMSAAEYDRARR